MAGKTAIAVEPLLSTSQDPMSQVATLRFRTAGDCLEEKSTKDSQHLLELFATTSVTLSVGAPELSV